MKWVLVGVVTAAAGIIILSVVAIFTGGGVPKGDVDYVAGDIVEFPRYPGAEQLTGKSDVQVPDDMKRLLGTISGYRHYVMQNSGSQAQVFYDRQMEAGGFTKGQPRESNVTVYLKGEGRYALFLSQQEGGLHVFLGTDRQPAAP